MFKTNFAYLKKSWWKIPVLGLLIALLFASAPVLWPHIECSALGQGCSAPRDLACNPAGGNCCSEYGGERTAWAAANIARIRRVRPASIHAARQITMMSGQSVHILIAAGSAATSITSPASGSAPGLTA